MNKNLVNKIKNNASYKELIEKRSSFAWKMTIIMLIVYYAFILTIAFAPKALGVSMGGITTIGIPIGIVIIIFSFIMAGIYTRRANGEFDDLVKNVKRDLKEELKS
jgi:uncharacterized membrane protein (DUF485 family)